MVAALLVSADVAYFCNLHQNHRLQYSLMRKECVKIYLVFIIVLLGVILNTAGEAGEAGDVFSRPSYDSPGVPGGGRRHASVPLTTVNWR